jgi:hypothetical protein
MEWRSDLSKWVWLSESGYTGPGDPLSMYRSTFSLEEVDKFKNVSVPYVYDRKIQKLEVKPLPKLGNYEVGGKVLLGKAFMLRE